MSNTEITWLHLSDWHEGHTEESVYDRNVVREQLLSDIRDRKLRISNDLDKIDFIVFSGDAAFSGKKEQYTKVSEFFDQILEASGLKGQKNRLFIVPGNHDLEDEALKELGDDFKKPLNTELSALQQWIDKYLLPQSRTHNLLLSPFSSYQDFVSRYTGQEQPSYASFKSLECDNGVKVALLGLNSALMARRRNEEGKIADLQKLIVGEPQIDSRLRDIEGHKVKIAVMHHPFNWLCHEDEERVRPLLTSNFHFLLYGHRHKYEASNVVNIQGDCVVLAAGATYDSREHLNSYNFVHFDSETKKGKVYLRRWDNNVRQWIKAPFLSGRQVVYTGCYEFPPPAIRPKVLPRIGEEEYSEDKRISRLNEHYENIAKGIKEGTVVPVLGADINSCGRRSPSNPWDWELEGKKPPTNHEIVAHIERKFENIATIGCPFCDRDTLDPSNPSFPRGFPPECPLNTRQIDRLDLAYLSQYFWSRGQQNEAEQVRLEKAIYEIYIQPFDPTHLHEFLADSLIQHYASEDRPPLQPTKKYNFPLIVTTCFDTTLERILEEKEKPYDLVSYSDNVKGFIYRRLDFETNEQGTRKFGIRESEEINPKQTISFKGALSMEERPVIFRLYGPINWPKTMNEKGENFAITEDHFLSFLFNVISGEANFPDKLKAKLEASNLWFLGYNLSYWNSRILLNKIKHDPSHQWWSVQEKPTHLERELWQINGVELFSSLSFSSLEEYIKKIERRL